MKLNEKIVARDMDVKRILDTLRGINALDE